MNGQRLRIPSAGEHRADVPHTGSHVVDALAYRGCARNLEPRGRECVGEFHARGRVGPVVGDRHRERDGITDIRRRDINCLEYSEVRGVDGKRGRVRRDVVVELAQIRGTGARSLVGVGVVGGDLTGAAIQACPPHVVGVRDLLIRRK